MVQATLRALADLVPLLGADVVMGTSRIAVFADTKPRVREGGREGGRGEGGREGRKGEREGGEEGRVREGERKMGDYMKKDIFWEAIYIFYFLSFRQMQFLLFPFLLLPTLFLLPDTLSCKILPAPTPQPGRRGRNR